MDVDSSRTYVQTCWPEHLSAPIPVIKSKIHQNKIIFTTVHILETFLPHITQHNNTKHIDTRNNDIQHNGTRYIVLVC
jgi:hypothetical protein